MPVLWDYDENKVVGSITLNDHFEELLKEGNDFVLFCSRQKTEDGTKVTAMTLLPHPTERF